MVSAHVLVGYEITAGVGSRLIAIDTTDATATPIGPYLAVRDIRGAVVTSGGRLLVVDLTASELLEIGIATGLPPFGKGHNQLQMAIE